MRVLITRPQEDALRLAATLRARGHEPVVAPLLALDFLDGPEVVLDGIQAVLATSANGVRALARRTGRRDLPLFAVGPQTSEAASALGFVTVRNAQGDAAALAEAASGWASPGRGALLHVKSGQADSALVRRLGGKGFTVQSAVLYEVEPAAALPPGFAAALVGADAALFFSPMGARVFRALVQPLGTAHLIAVCISATTAAALAPLSFRETRIAPAPQQALLDCL